MNELAIYNFENYDIRTMVKNGEPWFVLKDVCNVLGIGNTTDTASRLDKDEFDKIEYVDSADKRQEMTVINESGLYTVIIRSNKPVARAFRKWVTSDVLPTIRKTGGYVNSDELFIKTYLPFADDNTKALFSTTLATVRQQNKLIEEMKPKAEFFDAVADSKDAIDIGSAAKVLNMGIGRNKLFDLLRREGVLMENNIPYQSMIDRGYFRTIEQKFTMPDGSTRINIKTLVYQKGLNYIRKIVQREVA